MRIIGEHKQSKKKKKRKIPSTAKLKKKLWKLFTAWIKVRDNNICYTCGVKCFGWNCQGGHFIPKSICGIELYFHEDNVHVQCGRCNLSEQGNIYVYGKKLGDKKVRELQKIRVEKKGIVWDRATYERKIKHYTNLLND